MTDSPRLFIVVVNFNSSHHVAVCLASIASASNRQIVIWDNGSNIDDVENLRTVIEGRADARLHESPVNLGFGAAVNRLVDGLDANPADLIWVLNPDTEIVGDAIASMARDLLGAGRERVISPLLISSKLGEHDTIWFAGGDLNRHRGLTTHAGIGDPAIGLGELPISTKFMTGAAPMMRLSTWTRIGGFREDLFLYWEDAAFSLRAADLDVGLFVNPSAVVRHFEGGSSGTATGRSTIFYYYTWRNRLIVCGDGWRGRLFVLLGRGLRETLKQLAVLVIRERSGRPRKLVAAMRGVTDGILGRTGERVARR